MTPTSPLATQAHTMLSLALIGPFHATLGNETPVELRTRKEQALLAYLAVEADRPHRRGALAELLWPERPAGVARTSLRQALSGLRRAIGGEHLLTTRYTVQFDAASDHWLDVDVYRAHMKATRGHSHDDPATCPICMGHRQQAVALYRGPFLAGLELDVGPAFHEWATLHREWLLLRQVEALRRLTLYRRGLGDLDRACRYARRWVGLDPLSEGARRELMAVLALSDRRQAALRQYESCRRILADQLGIEPGPETEALYEQIRSGQVRPITARRPTAPLHKLPVLLTPFVGREPELGRMRRRLSSPECRLLTVVGPGGVGKTRLALRAAAQAQRADTFADGVWFVPLETIASPDLLATTVAEALGLPVAPQRDSKTQLLDYLRPRTVLLVLDNFEHLLGRPGSTGNPPSAALRTGPTGGGDGGGADLLLEILREAPGAKIVVTSRERLNFQTEFLLVLEGLPHPDPQFPISDVGLNDAESFSAVRLFLERAGRVRAGFAATAETVRPIVRICQLVEGLPLGIELAAASVTHLTCEQVAQAIQEGLDVLAVPLSDLAQRQRSIRAVLGRSWRLLSEVEQATLRRLSVLRGSFGLEAACTVVEEAENPEGGDHPALLPLQSLVNKSLVRPEPLGRGDGVRRYSLHPLVRQYVAEKLAAHPEEDMVTRDHHAHFYLGFLQAREGEVDSERATRALEEIGAEIGNVRAAWQWAVDQQWASEIEASIHSLSRFYELRTLYREAARTFGGAADSLLPSARANGDTLRVVCWLLERQVSFLVRQGRYPEGLAVARALAELAQTTGDPLSKARGAFAVGRIDWRRGEYGQARAHLQRALSLVESVELEGAPGRARQVLTLRGACLNTSAAVCWSRGDLGGAKTNLKKLLAVFSRSGNRSQEIAATSNLGLIAHQQGEYQQAISYYKRALRIEQGLGSRRSAAPTNLGELHLELGAYDRADSYLQEALVINQETGARANVAGVLGDLGRLAHRRGKDTLARERYQEALSIAREVGDRSAQAGHWLGLGDALLGLDRLEDAAEAYANSLALRRELGQSDRATESLAGLARVHQAQGDLEQARVHVEEILDHLESGGTVEGPISPFQVYLTCYRVLHAGRDRRARRILETAQNLLQERAAKISDQRMRHSFLENVAAHRELVQAFERVSDAGRSPA